jgi:hypothetical protein
MRNDDLKLLDYLADDFRRGVEIARESKKRGLCPHLGDEFVLHRYMSLVAYGDMKDTVSSHALYVDRSGKGATSPKGLMIRINAAIKDALGKPVSEVETQEEAYALAQVRKALAVLIRKGEASGKLRAEIKSDMWAAIPVVYNFFI